MTDPLSLTVILPTYNERDNIPLLIAGILRHVRPPVKVLVVDDDSPDGTWQVVAEIAAADPRVRLLRRTTERGLTSAIWAGIQAADTAAVSWMDCDLAMPPETIPELLARLEAGADLAVGSRYVRGGKDVGHSFMARAFSVTINLFAMLLLGRRVRDYTSGFIAARRALFAVGDGTERGRLTLRGDYGEYCIDLLARAQRLGLRIEEVPYVCGARFSGQSKTGATIADYLRRGWKYVVTILRLAGQRINATDRNG
ncbi:MAG: polyprenol monophosphomannose synthase [Anaerolineae bacterium]|nr:polyprenol monophosphomannose synthase [Anaerolineae bacterium]